MIDPDDVKKILSARQNLEIKLILMLKLTVIELADYFEVPVTCIKKDLNFIAGEYSETDYSSQLAQKDEIISKAKREHSLYSVDNLKASRLRAIKRKINDKRKEKNAEEYDLEDIKNTVLADYGLWRMPVNIDEISKDIIIPDGLSSKRIEVIKNAYALVNRGIPLSYLINYLGLSKSEMEILRSNGVMNLTFRGTDVEAAVIKLVQNGADPKEVAQLTGYPKSDLKWVKEGKDINHKHKYYENRTKNGSPKSNEKEKIKSEAYKEHLTGKQITEIAKKYHVSRVTVRNWIREIDARKSRNSIP